MIQNTQKIPSKELNYLGTLACPGSYRKPSGLSRGSFIYGEV